MQLAVDDSRKRLLTLLRYPLPSRNRTAKIYANPIGRPSLATFLIDNVVAQFVVRISAALDPKEMDCPMRYSRLDKVRCYNNATTQVADSPLLCVLPAVL